MALGTLNILDTVSGLGDTIVADICAHGGYIYVSYVDTSVPKVSCYTFNGTSFNLESTYTISDGSSTRSLQRITAVDDGGTLRLFGDTQSYQYSLANTAGTLSLVDNRSTSGQEISVDTVGNVLHGSNTNSILAYNFTSGLWGSSIGFTPAPFNTMRTNSIIRVGSEVIVFADDQDAFLLRAFSFNGSAYTFKDSISQGISQRNRSTGTALDNLTIHCASNGVKAFKYNNGTLSLLDSDDNGGDNPTSQAIWIINDNQIALGTNGSDLGEEGAYVYSFVGDTYTMTNSKIDTIGGCRGITSDGTYVYFLNETGIMYALEIEAASATLLNKWRCI